MKNFYLLCFTISIYGTAFGFGDKEFADDPVQFMKNYIKEKVQIQLLRKNFETICPHHGYEFQEALVKLQKCEELIDTNSETLCSAVNNHFEECTKPVVSVMEDCFPEKSKDLPSFIVKTITGLSNHICKSDGEHLFELSNPCIMNQSYRMRRCFLKTRSRLQQYASSTPSKSEICEFLKSMRQCYKSHVESSCKNVITREALIGLYEATIGECDTKTEYALNEIE